MDAGLVVVLAVLGRESRREVRWAPWFWTVAGAVYVLVGTARFRSDQSGVGWVLVVIGATYLAFGAVGFVYLARVRRERSVQAQVQDRAEPGRPGAGG